MVVLPEGDVTATLVSVSPSVPVLTSVPITVPIGMPAPDFTIVMPRSSIAPTEALAPLPDGSCSEVEWSEHAASRGATSRRLAAAVRRVVNRTVCSWCVTS